MNKALELISQLIEEHEESGYCTDKKELAKCLLDCDIELLLILQYDIARYETLKNLYNELKRMEL